MELTTLLLNPKVLALLGPIGVVGLIAIYSFYKITITLLKRNDDIQEKRIQEAQEMQKEYAELASEVNKTLDILIKTFRRKNGNGHG